MPRSKAMTTKPSHRLARRRDEPVVCTCGRKVERRMRGQRYCCARCRDRGRERSRKAFLGRDTRAPATPVKSSSKINRLRSINEPSRPPKVSLARVIQIECFDPHDWETVTSPDGVTVQVAQLRPRYRYR